MTGSVGRVFMYSQLGPWTTVQGFMTTIIPQFVPHNMSAANAVTALLFYITGKQLPDRRPIVSIKTLKMRPDFYCTLFVDVGQETHRASWTLCTESLVLAVP